MERYCGMLQPAIRSRRFPYASITNHVVDRARLLHIQMTYSMQNDLTFKPPRRSIRSEQVPGCEYALERRTGLISTTLQLAKAYEQLGDIYKHLAGNSAGNKSQEYSQDKGKNYEQALTLYQELESQKVLSKVDQKSLEKLKVEVKYTP